MKEHKAQWLADGTLGLMVHHIVDPKGATHAEKTWELNRVINAFDLDSFIQQFDESGANWLIFTFGQCTQYFCSPNAWLDSIEPGHGSERDLMREIGERVHGMGKKLITYLPVGIPIPVEGYTPGPFRGGTHDPLFLDLYGCWLRSYSNSLGRLSDGWWFDGVLDFTNRYMTNWQAFCDDARAGNPDAIVALNDDNFCNGIEQPVSPYQDYLAGEVEILEDSQLQFGHIKDEPYQDEKGRWRERGKAPLPLLMPTCQYLNGVQWHALAPVDCRFSSKVSDHYYTDDELIKFVADCKAVKGAVTFNLPVELDGNIPEKSLKQFSRVSKAVLG
jgi:hypothetical protein